jgi:hypothetical protein
MLTFAHSQMAGVTTGRHHTATNGEGTTPTSHSLPNEINMTVLPPVESPLLSHNPSIEISNLRSPFQSVSDTTLSSKKTHPFIINPLKAPSPRCSKLVEALPPKAHSTLLLRSSNAVNVSSVKLPFATVPFVLAAKAPQSAFSRALLLVKHALNTA